MKVNIRELDQFLRVELGLRDNIIIHLIPSNTPGWEAQLTSPKNLGKVATSKSDPKNTFYVLYRYDLSGSKFIETISHEYVHIQQLSEKRWIPGESFQIWEGNRINLNNEEIFAKGNKKTVPWEKEAYSKEGVLTAKFLRNKKSILSSIESLINYIAA